MKIFRDFDHISGNFATCIGFFDGVHKGHQFLLEHLRREAGQHGLLAGAITFVNHPRRLIDPAFPLPLIDTLDERLAKLEATGIDACFLLDFTEEVRQLSAEQFIHSMLHDRMHVRRLLIGYDHRFGHNREEGFDDYVRYGADCGMEVVLEPERQDGDGLHYSSSEVRRALAQGDVAKAAAILGCPYRMGGQVIAGHQLGRKLGFPTANLWIREKDKIIPKRGVYAVLATLEDGSVHPAMLNIGCRPTVDGPDHKQTLEAHIIHWDGNLYGQQLRLDVVHRLREERRMESLDALKDQLRRDVDATQKVLSSCQIPPEMRQ